MWLQSVKQNFGQGWVGRNILSLKIGELGTIRFKKMKKSEKIMLHIDHIKLFEHDTPQGLLGIFQINVVTQN